MSVAEQQRPVDEAPPVLEAARQGWGAYLGVWLRGFVMGSADVVPGVSGGTMALILGIYEELIQSIRSLSQPDFLRALTSGRIGEAWRAGNLSFLVALGLGILTAVLSIARGLEYALEHYPVFVWSFFFGLVAASVIVVSKRIKAWTMPLVAMAALGTVFAYWLVGLVPAQTPTTWWFLVLSGAIAICAMILPGISGAFILVILGKYEYVLGAVKDFDFGVMALVGFGAVAGLLSFARVLGWLFKHYHDLTLTLLIGLMLGSLRKIWPWQEPFGEVEGLARNVMPAIGTELFVALLLMVVGFIAVVALERLALIDDDPSHT